MLILTDCPDYATSFLPQGGRWEKSSRDSLSRADQNLWHLLSTGENVWKAEMDDMRPTSFWSSTIIIGDAPASQFDVLREFLRESASLAGNVACLALTGKGFHGHRHRSWIAAPGNLHLSVALVSDLSAAENAPALTMLPAVATVEAISKATGNVVSPGIKWVNDILLNEQKIAGVLTSTQIKLDRIESIVLGVGINVDMAPEVKPSPFVPAAGCLADLAGRNFPGLSVLFWEMMASLGERYRDLEKNGPGHLYKSYTEASLVEGRHVRIWEETTGEKELTADWPPPMVSGLVTAIEPDLSLRIKNSPVPVRKGRLAFEEACRVFGL
jgi:BirA family biotin operon repressor/biotin-[acetyl-CoA-carboxylase] ligase